MRPNDTSLSANARQAYSGGLDELSRAGLFNPAGGQQNSSSRRDGPARPPDRSDVAGRQRAQLEGLVGGHVEHPSIVPDRTMPQGHGHPAAFGEKFGDRRRISLRLVQVHTNGGEQDQVEAPVRLPQDREHRQVVVDPLDPQIRMQLLRCAAPRSAPLPPPDGRFAPMRPHCARSRPQGPGHCWAVLEKMEPNCYRGTCCAGRDTLADGGRIPRGRARTPDGRHRRDRRASRQRIKLTACIGQAPAPARCRHALWVAAWPKPARRALADRPGRRADAFPWV
jgi:hypothetical protein